MRFLLFKWLLRLIVRVYIGRLWHLEGVENVPLEGALIVCANHVGTVDPPLLGAYIPREMYFLAKRELFSNALKRWFAEGFRAIPLERHTADRRAIRRALQTLERGQALCIFPEGTRVPDARLHHPEPGVGFLVRKSGAQVLPVAVFGTEACMPKGSNFPRRVGMTIRIGRPFAATTEGPSHEANEAVADRIMREIAALLPPEYRGAYGGA